MTRVIMVMLTEPISSSLIIDIPIRWSNIVAFLFLLTTILAGIGIERDLSAPRVQAPPKPNFLGSLLQEMPEWTQLKFCYEITGSVRYASLFDSQERVQTRLQRTGLIFKLINCDTTSFIENEEYQGRWLGPYPILTNVFILSRRTMEMRHISVGNIMLVGSIVN